MAASGSAGVGGVSAGIAEALYTTAAPHGGHPSVWFFNKFTNDVDKFTVEMQNTARPWWTTSSSTRARPKPRGVREITVMGMSTVPRAASRPTSTSPAVDVVLCCHHLHGGDAHAAERGRRAAAGHRQAQDLPLDEKNQSPSRSSTTQFRRPGARLLRRRLAVGANNYEALNAKLAERTSAARAGDHHQGRPPPAFGVVRKVMKACNKMGFETVSLITSATPA